MDLEEIESKYRSKVEEIENRFIKGKENNEDKYKLEKEYKNSLSQAIKEYEKNVEDVLKRQRNNPSKKKTKKEKTKIFRVDQRRLTLSKKDELINKYDVIRFNLQIEKRRIQEKINSPGILYAKIKFKMMIKRIFKAILFFIKKVIKRISNKIKKISISSYEWAKDLLKKIVSFLLKVWQITKKIFQRFLGFFKRKKEEPKKEEEVKDEEKDE